MSVGRVRSGRVTPTSPSVTGLPTTGASAGLAWAAMVLVAAGMLLLRLRRPRAALSVESRPR
jgi:hypothetical protein